MKKLLPIAREAAFIMEIQKLKCSIPKESAGAAARRFIKESMEAAAPHSKGSIEGEERHPRGKFERNSRIL